MTRAERLSSSVSEYEESERREAYGLWCAKRDEKEGDEILSRGDREGRTSFSGVGGTGGGLGHATGEYKAACGLSLLVREGLFAPPNLWAKVASPALTVSSLGWFGPALKSCVGLGHDRQVRGGKSGIRKGRRTDGPTLGLPPLPSGDVVGHHTAARTAM